MLQTPILANSPSLAGLRVDTDDGLVGASNVCGVDGDVWNAPVDVALALTGLLSLETLLDGVLVTTGEGSEDQLTGVGVAGVDGEAGALDDCVDDGEHVGEVETGVEALGVAIEA